MSADGEDSGPGRREVAHRLFAAEFDDATVSYSESDEERAPKYVVTPTGARVNRLFAVGVLTEVESVNEDVLRARVVDPTGAFVSYAGQYQPDAAAFFERATPPTFVALTGKARTFEPDDGDRIYTSVRPESVAEVDAETRDRWTVSAAEATLRRVAVMTDARETGLRGEDLYAELRGRGHDESLARGVAVALDRYGTTPAYLDAVRRLALDALEVVAGDREEVRPLDAVPDEGGEASVGPVPESVRVAAGDASATAEETQTDEPPAEETQTDEPPAEETQTDDSKEETVGTDDPDAETPATAASTEEQAETATTEDDAAAAAVTDAADATAETAADATDDATPDATAETAANATDDATAETAADATDDATPDAMDASTETPDAADESGAASSADPDDLGDFESSEEMYELDEEEREAVESKYDVGFESAAEVDDPSEADIDVPDADDVVAEDESGGETADAADESGDEDAGTDADADLDLESVAVETMSGLDDGDGVDRDRVVAAVVDEYGVAPDAVDDAIQDALMSGRCYEPSEDTLKAI